MLHYQTRVAAIGNEANIVKSKMPKNQRTKYAPAQDSRNVEAGISGDRLFFQRQLLKHRLRGSVDHNGGKAGTIPTGDAVFRAVEIRWEHLYVEGNFAGDVRKVVELREQILRGRAVGAAWFNESPHQTKTAASGTIAFFFQGLTAKSAGK